jgi:hypothetical protein
MPGQCSPLSEEISGRSSPRIGALSTDGSRVWDGRFWVVKDPSPLPAQIVEPALRPAPIDFMPEHRGSHIGGVIFGSILGFAMTHFALNLSVAFMPPSDSVGSALDSLGTGIEIWAVITFASAVVILSIGRQGIDVLLLRSVVVAFALGAGFASMFPIWFFSVEKWLLAMLVVGLEWAVVGGPVLMLFAILANLLWYRSFHSLRPQLGIFNRSPR